MSGINPYASLFLQALYSQGNTNPFAVQSVDLLSLPDGLKNLSQATTIQGQLIEISPQNQASVKTAGGDIVEVLLKAQLPVGTRVDLQIPAGKNPIEILLQPRLSQAVQNQPVTTQAQSVQPTQTVQTASTQTISDVKNLQSTAQQATLRSGSGETILRVGQAVRLSLLPASLQSSTAVSNLQKTQGGTVSQSSSLTPPTTTPSSVINSRPSQATQIVPSEAKASLSSEQIPHASQNVGGVDLKITNISIPNPQQSQDMRVVAISTNLSQPQVNVPHQITIQATGHSTTQGNPVVQFTPPPHSNAKPVPIFFELQYPAQNVTATTQITLEALKSTSVQTQTNQISKWTEMHQVIEHLVTQLPMVQGQSLLQTLPNASQTQSFPAAAVLFLAAAKGGDLSAWLGQTAMGVLAQAPADIRRAMDKIMRDTVVDDLSKIDSGDRPRATQSSPDWRGYMMPMVFGDEILKLPVWIHNYQDGQNEDGENALSTRFVIDLNLSRMGNIQIDGIIKQSVAQFDMALLSESDFGEDAKVHIENIWSHALQSMDMRGKIQFRRVEAT